MPSKDNQFRIFLLGKNSVIPKESFNSCLHARVFAYISEKRTDNSIVSLYERITYHDNNKYEIDYIKTDTNNFSAIKINKEEFLATKPKDQDPIIGNMSIYTKKNKQYWIISHQDLGISFGFTTGEDWPWGYMKVKEISPNNFGKACNYFLENPFNPTKYKSS